MAAGAKTGRSATGALVAALVVLVAVLLINWQTLTRYHQEQRINRMMVAGDDAAVPPSLALVTFAVGPMRGLIADVLWWRMIRMQDEGNYFEAIQLAEWITHMQPDFGMVWAYHAWNMSSNLVNEVESAEERWKWIEQSLDMLRQRGLKYNPGDRAIREQLAQILHYRIGGTGASDTQRQYYREQFAKETSRLFRSGLLEELEQIAAAPADEATLRAAPGVANLLAAAAAVDLNLLDLGTFRSLDTLTTAQSNFLFTLTADDQQRVLAIRYFLVRRYIETEWGMDPARMVLIDRRYGPLDWRLWQAHTIYWAADDGFETPVTPAPAAASDDHGHHGEPDPILLGAMGNTFIQQAMVASFWEGKLIFRTEDTLFTGQNLQIAPNIDDFLHHVMERPDAGPGTKAVYCSFHSRAALIFFLYGMPEMGREMFEAYAAECIPASARRHLTFEQFLVDQAGTIFQDQMRDRQSMVVATLVRAYTMMAVGNEQEAYGLLQLAKLIWEQNQLRQAENPSLLLPPFEELQTMALALATSPDRSKLSDAQRLPEDIRAKLARQKGEAPLLDIAEPKEKLSIEFFRHGEH